VLSQADVNVRVLVIDDASSDETPQIGHEIAAASSAVEFRRHEVNTGHIATYNEGLLGWSRAEYVVLLSADDMLTFGSLRRAVHIMESDKDIGMVYGPVTHCTEHCGLPGVNGKSYGFKRFLGSEWIEARCRAGHNVIASPEVVVRGDIQRAIGGYRPELPHTADLEMWLRFAAVSSIGYVRRVPQAFYRVHSASMFRTQYRTSLADLCQRKAAFDSFFHSHPYITNAERLQDLANRALAREALWEACRAYDRNEVKAAHAGELIEFAKTTCVRASALPEYRALGRRQWFSPVVCHRTQLFAAPALVRRVGRWWSAQKWKRRGI
jgi:glycosyltransferase involved in cell wall biosynthesis